MKELHRLLRQRCNSFLLISFNLLTFGGRGIYDRFCNFVDCELRELHHRAKTNR